jgi:hypothetical protein
MATSKTPAKKTASASVAKTAAKKAPVKKAAIAAPVKKAAAAKVPVMKPTAAAKKPAVKHAAAAAGKKDLTPEQRYMMVAEAAYYRAERQGFMGDPAQDWVAAEAEIADLLSKQK